MDYQESQNYLSGLIKFGIKFGLERFAELCRRLGNPEEKLRVIHVGGTNGKGSTCTFISSILDAAGLNVGTYLSPYVYDVRERIQVNGVPISEADFARLMTVIAPHMEAISTTELGQGTEFEAKTAMAFLHFAEQELDCSVIEVGMGGRFDATNLVRPSVSVITNVSLDHVERLGKTIAEIARDKAGIAKDCAPLITAADDEAWPTIYETARKQGVEEIWRVLRRDYEPDLDLPFPDVQVTYQDRGGIEIRLPDGSVVGPVELRLAGDFQLVNAATAAAAVVAMENNDPTTKVSHTAIKEGLSKAYLPGRLETLRRNPTVVIDAAHNLDGARKLAQSVPRLFDYNRLILVVGMLSSHSAEEFAAVLAPIADEVIATRPQWEKARPASEVADAAMQFNRNVRAVEPVAEAVQAAMSSAAPGDLVLITGSFYTIGEVNRNSFE